jgi:hypothetical protein
VKIKTTKYDQTFSKLIRTRDVVCQRCLRGGRLECSHIFSRRHKGGGLRWDTRNACGKCFKCHRWWHENPVEARDWLVGMVGQDLVDELTLIANTNLLIPDKYELDILYKEMKDEIEYLESIPWEERVHLQFRNRHNDLA